MKRVGVLLSGSGTNLQALLDHPGSYEIAVVISNRRDAFGLERARQAGVPAVWVPHRRRSREDFEADLTDTLRQHQVDWVVCAGFMRILTAGFLDRWPERVLNIHPALLPSFPGVGGQAQAFAYGVRIAGATVHFVDSGTDTGPIIAQAAVPILQDDDQDAVKQRILQKEHRLYPMCLDMAVEGRLRIEGRKVVVKLRDGESLLL